MQIDDLREKLKDHLKGDFDDLSNYCEKNESGQRWIHVEDDPLHKADAKLHREHDPSHHLIDFESVEWREYGSYSFIMKQKDYVQAWSKFRNEQQNSLLNEIKNQRFENAVLKMQSHHNEQMKELLRQQNIEFGGEGG